MSKHLPGKRIPGGNSLTKRNNSPKMEIPGPVADWGKITVFPHLFDVTSERAQSPTLLLEESGLAHGSACIVPC